jgi:hypothetical protein
MTKFAVKWCDTIKADGKTKFGPTRALSGNALHFAEQLRATENMEKQKLLIISTLAELEKLYPGTLVGVTKLTIDSPEVHATTLITYLESKPNDRLNDPNNYKNPNN